jgi:methionine aminotransferase
MEKGHNQYAPMPGLPELRARLSQIIETLYGRHYSPAEEITITAGGTQALFTAIAALVGPGDEVIVFDPSYDSYGPSIALAGGIPVFCQLSAPHYRIPWAEVRELITPRTKMIVVNNPHNPSGTVWTSQDLLALEKITEGTPIIVLSDEVYEHIVLDQRIHESVAKNEKLSERSLIVGSFGKTLHATGWKMGYIAGPGKLIQEFRKVHQYNVFSCNTPIQWAISEYLEDEQVYRNLRDFYTSKRDIFLKGLEGSCFAWTPAEGTYFQLLNYEKISTDNDFDLARKFTRQNGVASIPVSVFNHSGKDDKMLRFCFAKDEQTLEKATKILRQL